MAQCSMVNKTVELHAPRVTRHALVPSDEDLERFRSVQRLAYAAAEEVAGHLRPGMTERQAAKLLRTWLVDHGTDDWFHLPFAWFGDRTAFRNFKAPIQFFPSGRRLEEGMAYILDAAPVVQGATADIGFSGS